MDPIPSSPFVTQLSTQVQEYQKDCYSALDKLKSLFKKTAFVQLTRSEIEALDQLPLVMQRDYCLGPVLEMYRYKHRLFFSILPEALMGKILAYMNPNDHHHIESLGLPDSYKIMWINETKKIAFTIGAFTTQEGLLIEEGRKLRYFEASFMDQDTLERLIVHTPNIQSLVLSYCKNLTFYRTSDFFQKLDPNQLHTIKLFCTDIGNNRIQSLTRFTNLTTLEINLMPNLNEDSILAISRLSSLTHLQIHGCHIGDFGLQALAVGLTQLRRIDIPRPAFAFGLDSMEILELFKGREVNFIT